MKLNKITVFFSVLLATVFMASCSDDDKLASPNYVSFGSSNVMRFELLEGQLNASKTIEVYTSNTSNVDRTFQVVVNTAGTTATASQYTVPTSVTVPANSRKGELVVTSGVAAAGKKLSLDIVAEAGLSVGKTLLINFVQVCPEDVKTVTLDLYQDRYGEEITYELYNSDSQLIESGGPFPNLAAAGTQQISVDWCLAPGTYTFLIIDSYGDGICCGAGNGYYTIGVVTPDGINVLVEGAGDYGQFAQNEFTVE